MRFTTLSIGVFGTKSDPIAIEFRGTMEESDDANSIRVQDTPEVVFHTKGHKQNDSETACKTRTRLVFGEEDDSLTASEPRKKKASFLKSDTSKETLSLIENDYIRNDNQQFVYDNLPVTCVVVIDPKVIKNVNRFRDEKGNVVLAVLPLSTSKNVLTKDEDGIEEDKMTELANTIHQICVGKKSRAKTKKNKDRNFVNFGYDCHGCFRIRV